MTKLSEIIGQGTAITVLKSALPPGKPVNSYLFVGPEGVGKRTAALAFANSLFCQSSINNDACEANDACGICVPCVKMKGGSFPDFKFIKPTIHKNKTKEEINIEDIRELIASLAYKPYEAERKIVILDGVDQMNTQAANAFLKTLEEPPGDTILILIAANLNTQLPTIISRCQIIRFRPVPFGEMTRFLMEQRGMDENQARLASALSKGSPGMADMFKDDEKVRAEAIGMLESSLSASVGALYNIAHTLDKKANRKRADRLLPALQELIRDMLVVKLAGKYDNLINKDIAVDIEKAARNYSVRELFKSYDLADEMISARKWNINPLLVMSLLLMEMREK